MKKDRRGPKTISDSEYGRSWGYRGDDVNLLTLFDFFNSYWNKEVNFYEWHEGQVVPVPKSGDLSNPSK